MKMLKVFAVGTAMVPLFEAHEAGQLRFVGRRFVRGDEAKGIPHRFEPLETPVEVPCRAEYIDELRAGNLRAADEETAKAAGVAFAQGESRGKGKG